MVIRIGAGTVILGANWIATAQLGWSGRGTRGEAVGANARAARSETSMEGSMHDHPTDPQP
jgi:hypothetical protein